MCRLRAETCWEDRRDH
ncbi:hypothetical protein Tco_1281235, partial [Tanacetum coccineum]